jgi:S-adenosylmethionine decarboxylase proenzyme
MKIRQLLIDAYGCECDLNDSKLLLPALLEAAKSMNANVVKEIVYHYENFGLTIILLLAETHASLYTWPEFNYAAIEIFLCNEDMDPYKFWKIVEKVLKPKKAKIKEIIRDVSE